MTLKTLTTAQVLTFGGEYAMIQMNEAMAGLGYIIDEDNLSRGPRMGGVFEVIRPQIIAACPWVESVTPPAGFDPKEASFQECELAGSETIFRYSQEHGATHEIDFDLSEIPPAEDESDDALEALLRALSSGQ